MSLTMVRARMTLPHPRDPTEDASIYSNRFGPTLTILLFGIPVRPTVFAQGLS